MKYIIWLAVGILVGLGCSAADKDFDDNPGTDADTDADTDSDSDSDSDTDTTSGSVCDEQDIPIAHVPIRLMLLQDRSSSMSGPNWTQAKNAIQGLLDTFNDDGIEFGLDYFPDPTSTSCATWAPVVLDTAPGQQEAIMDELNSINPISSTPLYCAIDNFNEPGYAPIFTDNEMEHYLVVVADGEDSCSTDCDGGYGGNVTPALLAGITTQLVDNGTKVIVIGDRRGRGQPRGRAQQHRQHGLQLRVRHRRARRLGQPGPGELLLRRRNRLLCGRLLPGRRLDLAQRRAHPGRVLRRGVRHAQGRPGGYDHRDLWLRHSSGVTGRIDGSAAVAFLNHDRSGARSRRLPEGATLLRRRQQQ
jgi:hypothetical protein